MNSRLVYVGLRGTECDEDRVARHGETSSAESKPGIIWGDICMRAGRSTIQICDSGGKKSLV